MSHLKATLASVRGPIAEILEIPVGTVMSRLYRGRKRLEAAMLDYARERGYLRDGEPNKRRSDPRESDSGDADDEGE